MFQKATKKKAKLKLALFGASGAGKTYTALRIATGIGGRIAFIDTENGSASKYSDRFQFDECTITKPTIDNYVATIAGAKAEGYDVLIIDSLSHGWADLLEEIEKLTTTKYKGNSFRAWGEGSPKQRKLVQAITGSDMHIIATMRCKTEWVLEENERGKQVPRKIGTNPEQGKGIEYEFDLLMELDHNHNGSVSKDRTGKYQDAAIEKPDEQFGSELAAWLSDGEDMPLNVMQSEPEAKAITQSQTDTLLALIKTRDIPEEECLSYIDLLYKIIEDDDLDEYNVLLRRVSAKKAVPDALTLRKAIAEIITKMQSEAIDGFDTEARMRNSFMKHLGTHTLKECNDVAKLRLYLTHLESKVGSK